MSKYVSAERLKQVVDRLSHSKARSRLLEFLILKRAISLKGSPPLPLSMREPALIQAINEYLSYDPQIYHSGSIKTNYLINIFDSASGDAGYRTEKYYSNGFNDTISGGGFSGVVT